MKALTLVDKKKFEIIEKSIPKAEGNKVVIKVKNTGICGSDIHMIWQTGYNAGTNFVIGHEFAGEIYDAGNSTTFKVGDRVVAMEIDSCLKDECEFCGTGRENICDHVLEGGPGIGTDGGYGQYVAVREDMVRILPDNVSFVSGAMVEPASISMHGLKLAHVNKDSKVLITGCGAIGMFAAACAHALDIENVYITEANKERIKLVSNSGFVKEAFDAMDENINDKLTEVAPSGFDAVIECSGNKTASTMGLNHLKKGGHMSMIAYGDAPEINIFNFVNSEYHLSGSLFFKTEEFEEVIKLMSEGKLNLEPYSKLIEMEEVQESLEKLEQGIESPIKYVIKMND